MILPTLLAVLGGGGSRPAAPPLPDGVLTAGPLAQPHAWFGYTLSKGDLRRDRFGTLDDLVVAAIQESAPGGPPGVGGAYVFSPHAATVTGFVCAHLAPSDPLQSGTSLGQLGNAIGRPDGASAPPRVLLGTPFRDVAFGPFLHVDAGAVEMFDPSSALPPERLVAPVPAGSIHPGAVEGFGHAVAVGEIDGQPGDDVVVGAPYSDGLSGRVYVFFGGHGFPSTWIGLGAPTPASSGYRFGVTALCLDLDGDGKDEVLIDSYERTVDTGHVHLYRGADLAAAKSTPSRANTVIPATALGAFQVIAAPAGLAAVNDCFGWQLTDLGDLGGTQGAFDGKADVAIYSEGWDPSTTPPGLHGNLYVHFNASTPGAPRLAIAQGKVLRLTSPVDPGTSVARFGRGAARVDWPDEGGAPRPALAVGEPGFCAPGASGSGRVYLYYGPLGPSTLPGSYEWALDPPSPEAGGAFGFQVLGLRYTDAYPGRQLAVSACHEGGDAGAVHLFRPKP